MYTHSNSCVYARSHECVSRRVMFERIQTVLLKKWYTKQTLTLIFWQTLAIILKKCRKITHTFSAWFPTSKIGLQNILSKSLKGGPSLWILGNVPFSSTPVIGPDLHQSVKASNALGVSNHFNPPTEPVLQALSFMLTLTHTHNWDQMFTL